jgi:hypothetical protein
MGFHISIPPVRCGTRELVRGYQHLLTVVALNHLQLLLDLLEPIISVHRFHDLTKGGWLSALKISKTIPRQRWRRLMLHSLHVYHGLKHLCLHHQHLLKSRRRGWQWVDILVVLSVVVPVVFVVAVPCVSHLKYKC